MRAFSSDGSTDTLFIELVSDFEKTSFLTDKRVYLFNSTRKIPGVSLKVDIVHGNIEISLGGFSWKVQTTFISVNGSKNTQWLSVYKL